MLPRLKRFADVLVGEKREGKALLRRALQRMLAEHHRYQRGTPLDRFAFTEIYRLWLGELRDHADPLRQAKVERGGFRPDLSQGSRRRFRCLHRDVSRTVAAAAAKHAAPRLWRGLRLRGCRQGPRFRCRHDSGAPDQGECEPCRSLERGLAGADERERHHRDSLSGRGHRNTTMTELSDELLVAYVDGQLVREQTRAVDKVLEHDDVVARRVEALKDAHGRFEVRLRGDPRRRADRDPRRAHPAADGPSASAATGLPRSGSRSSASALRSPRWSAAMVGRLSSEPAV